MLVTVLTTDTVRIRKPDQSDYTERTGRQWLDSMHERNDLLAAGRAVLAWIAEIAPADHECNEVDALRAAITNAGGQS
jgi:hypothetical protein